MLKLRRIEEQIRRHCSGIDSTNDLGISSMAHHILVMCENAALAAGASEDVIELEELERSLRKAEQLLQDLSPTSKRKINYLSPQIVVWGEREHGLAVQIRSRTADGQAFAVRAEAVASLRMGIQRLRSDPAFRRGTSTKRNYQAAAVAAACRKVWREELATRTRGRSEPPKTVNAYHPGPMGRFIQDVFKVLSIGATPASAMANLKDLGGEEALLLSLEEG